MHGNVTAAIRIMNIMKMRAAAHMTIMKAHVTAVMTIMKAIAAVDTSITNTAAAVDMITMIMMICFPAGAATIIVTKIHPEKKHYS